MMRLFVTGIALLALLLAGIALAKELPADWHEWFGNPTYAVLAVMAGMAALRRVVPQIDGPVLVGLASVAMGALGGAIGHLLGLLAVSPYAAWQVPWGGMVYGLLAGGTAFLGVNLFDLVMGRIAKFVKEAGHD